MLVHATACLGLVELSNMLVATAPHCFDSLSRCARMTYALLKNDWQDFKAGIESISSTPTDEEKSLLIAAVANWPQFNPSFSDFAADLLKVDESIIVSSCKLLFHQKKYEAYDRIVAKSECYSNIFTQMLGDHFFREQQFDLAFDYYSLLLERNELHPKGYENIAQLYFVQEERDEALHFLAKGIDVHPGEFRLYVKRYIFSSEEERNSAKLMVHNTFPYLKPFLQF
ncbi:hypothetical protein D3C75_852770 [compost metagenome]